MTPDRTSSGYRKFSHADVERLRYVLLLQRDHHQPLARIVEILDAIDRGLEPPPLVDLNPTGARRRAVGRRAAQPRVVPAPRRPAALASRAAQDRRDRPRRSSTSSSSTAWWCRAAAPATTTPTPWSICTTARELADFGLEPRHLRAFKTAADREVGLVEQVVAPQRRASDPAAPARRGGHGLPARRAVGADARDPGQDRAAQALTAAPCSRGRPATPGRGDGSRVKACAKSMSSASGSRCRRTSRSCCSARSTGERYLPIWIGAVEATAIAFAQQGVVPPRPLTHDLLKDVLEATGNQLDEVRITEVQGRRLLRDPGLRLRGRGERPPVGLDRAGAAHRLAGSSAPRRCSTRPASPCPTSRRTRSRSSASSSTRSRPRTSTPISRVPSRETLDRRCGVRSRRRPLTLTAQPQPADCDMQGGHAGVVVDRPERAVP